jgi:formate dehydrogenase assembly factor FdhD
MAGGPVIAAVGAASGLAVSWVEEHGIIVVGFPKDDRYNSYTDQNRIHLSSKLIHEARV